MMQHLPNVDFLMYDLACQLRQVLKVCFKQLMSFWEKLPNFWQCQAYSMKSWVKRSSVSKCSNPTIVVIINEFNEPTIHFFGSYRWLFVLIYVYCFKSSIFMAWRMWIVHCQISVAQHYIVCLHVFMYVSHTPQNREIPLGCKLAVPIFHVYGHKMSCQVSTLSLACSCEACME